MVCRQMTSSTYTHFMLKNNPLEPSWKQRLQSEFIQPYMHHLTDFLSQEHHDEKTIHPKPDQYFNALNSTPFDAVKVVILGQDPYHGEGQAHGLSFSVPHGVRIPPSLRNIFKELQHDLGIPIASHGCLQSWAAQGVLLLNSVLTVERKQAKSHQGKGWEKFTDTIIAHLNHEKKGIVFLLWGAYAQQKGMFIDQNKHLVLKSVHPSPLSAYRGFFGQHHFSQTNQYLLKMGNTPIDWSLPSGISNSL